ncbi:DUF1217 domain-containing protein [Rhodobacter sp. Har01]|uniref:DUF1217 domain-containing protein n=1 Tax=Rhodobacter sp. Har01 TaxID=2883999 RepID=UPI001D092233|nr:DUF1217 domain-containing protein [Rhodobacter sp. Har01]MCB6177952.1 DUF1217 domain-containing protein [Rhodobacter sp. Har01]
MSFQPVIPLGGYAGWTFLKRTMATQQAALQASPANQRDEAYFRANIGKVNSAKELVADRRLLKVALTAYGLESDIDSKAFIQKVLQDGTLKTDALANKLTDKRYRDFSAAFGFGDFSTPRSKMSDFADKVLKLYITKTFETAVGEQDDTMRLALNAERELGSLAAKSSSEDVKWYTILGNKPLRSAMQTALGLPTSIAYLDIDKQLTMFKAKARSTFGSDTVSQFADADKMAKLVRTYLVRSEIATQGSGMSAASTALQLLSR